ncbi:hypothetical protein NXZ75_18000 [Lysinibacillus sphaericus]|uniref:hypothetical protein n=1 Tax=Lysinibacillus sphaericus TaxID=1421 RepID=UPI001E618C3F|nr:hypothetical protein [Lysinibacillus sphaericus]MCS1384104.1 hypothetical protein [Lysinibacillus sphaericus]
MKVFELCKFLIDRKRYGHAAMLNKVNVFYANNQLEDHEYTELLTIMDAQQTQADA